MACIKNTAARKSGKTVSGVKGKKRAKPGDAALKEIRRYQASTELLIDFLSFVRFDLHPIGSDLRFQPAAIGALQAAAESYIVTSFQIIAVIFTHDKRVTLLLRDFNIIKGLLQKSM
ncbi:histone 3 [Chaetomium tenue]|uniref:Histone 3 n=1 Tax=Chaetomium tenue TaxID=1854479 RepID=A0ACB7PFE5_9PEZI|nr:histone 3 [Chaetomium globosum]